jgi:hypothetical protein
VLFPLAGNPKTIMMNVDDDYFIVVEVISDYYIIKY